MATALRRDATPHSLIYPRAPPLDLPFSTVRLYGLVARCMQHDEPVLLVGETGTGKTTVCQLYAQAVGQQLHMINCHQHTETSDFIGGIRPMRGRSFMLRSLGRQVEEIEAAAAEALGKREANIAVETGEEHDIGGEPCVESLLARVSAVERELGVASLPSSPSPSPCLGALYTRIAQARADLGRCASLFEWSDGPLLRAMRRGELLLIDEISLADDAVLERLNSVLDPSRSIVLPEKGSELEEVRASPSFRLLATMNPGGDFGKRELSPALRNRFTEVWVPAVSAREELMQLLQSKLASEAKRWDMAGAMLAFVEFLVSRDH